MTDLAIRLHFNGAERRLRGVRVPHSGELLLYTSDAVAMLAECDRRQALLHFLKLARRTPALQHHSRPLGARNDTQLCYKHGNENVITFDGLRRVACLSRNPAAMRNQIAFLSALFALWAEYAALPRSARELSVVL